MWLLTLDAALVLTGFVLRMVRSPRLLSIMTLLPLLQLWLLSQLFGHAFSLPSYSTYLAPGAVLMGSLIGAAFSGLSLLADRRSGYLEHLVAVPASRGMLLLARALAVACVTLVSTLLVLLVSLLFGVEFSGGAGAVPAILVLAVLLSLTYTGLAFLLATVTDRHDLLLTVGGSLLAASIVVSDMIVPSADLPVWILRLSHLNPLATALHGVRAIIWQGPSWQNYAHNLVILMLMATTSISLALVVFCRRAGSGL